MDPTDMSPKELKRELRGYGLCTAGYLDKESLVDAVRRARREGLEADYLVAPAPAFLVEQLGSLCDIYRDEEEELPACNNCGDGCACAAGEMPLWRDGAFFGMVTMPRGERKMLHNPRDLLIDDVTREEEGLGAYPGHRMTIAELESVEATMPFLCDVNARVLDGFLVNFSGKENAQEETLYQKGSAEIKSLVHDIVKSFPESVEHAAAVMQLSSILETKHILGRWGPDEEARGLVSFIAGGSGPISPRRVKSLEAMKLSLDKYRKKGKVRECAEGGTFRTPQEAVDAVDALMERLVAEKNAFVSEEDDMMYPFHTTLKAPFSDAPSPRIRAGDIVEVTFEKAIDLGDFAVPAGADVQVYVVSQTSWGKVTGVVQTNKGKHFWVHFDSNRTKRMVAKGCNWD